ncbi:MAG: MFS transporter [Legionella sp. 21-45-4]|nr:MAG: MFS transporter [Legionella sp. 21-45-4]
MRTPIEHSQKRLLWGIVACVMGAFFYCYEFVLRIVPGALQSELCEAFGNISAATFGQIAAMYYFAYSPMQFPVGMLMDRFGPRRLLTFACLCCTLGSTIFGYSNSLLVVSFGRFLVGLGSSFAFVGVLSLALHWLPRRYFSLVTGLVTTLAMLGVVYGEVKITELTVRFGLHEVLGLLVLIGAVLSGLIFLMVKDGSDSHPVHSDSISVFLRQVWQVLISSEVWLIGFVGACLYTSLSVFGELWGKSYLEQAHHLNKIDAARAISMMFLGWAVGAPIAGFLSDWSARRVLPIVIGALMSFICISTILYCQNLSFFMLNLLLFFYGVFSGTEIIVFIMAKENTRSLVSGTVFAAVNMIVSLVGAIFQPLIGFLLDMFGNGRVLGEEHFYAAHDYQLALSIIPLSLLMVILLSFFLKDADSRHDA